MNVVSHISQDTSGSFAAPPGPIEQVRYACALGALTSVMNAINDALRPFHAKVFAQPFTPESILKALGRV